MAWFLFTSHPPHQRVEEYLSIAGLYDVVRVGRMQYDRHLLTAMVERWRPESHRFHLPFGEATITLQDVQVLFGLRVDGHPINLADVFGRDRSWRDMLEALTGYVRPISGRGFVSLTNLTDFIKDELEMEPIGDVTPVTRVEKIARLYMLVILGGILFLNSSGINIRLHFLAFLDLIGSVGSYSWGNAVLAYLYRSLFRASYKGEHILYGYLPLIQVWCWEKNVPLQPGLYELEDNDAALPYATRWTRGVERNTESHYSLIVIRDQIDHMTEVQFVVQSLGELLGRYFDAWRDRHEQLAVPVHGAILRDYTLWYLSHERLFIGNPAIKEKYKARFVPHAGTIAALSRGLCKILNISFEVQKDPAHALWGHEIENAIPGPSGTQNVGQTFTQHTNEMFDVSTSGRSLESLMGYAMPTSSSFHLDSMSFPTFICQAGQIRQCDTLPTWVRPLNDTQIEGSSSVVPSTDDDEFITIDAYMAHPLELNVPVMRAKKKRKDHSILPAQDIIVAYVGESARIRKYKGRVFALQHEPEVARAWLPNSDSPSLAMARAFGDELIEEQLADKGLGHSTRSLAECLTTSEDEEWSALEEV
ncbi:serine/threonine-protein phosphatase 7 long form [Capsicum chacoense]